jgi:hypothetical protein
MINNPGKLSKILDTAHTSLLSTITDHIAAMSTSATAGRPTLVPRAER